MLSCILGCSSFGLSLSASFQQSQLLPSCLALSYPLHCPGGALSPAALQVPVSWAAWEGAVPGTALCLPRMTRSSRRKHPSAWLGAAVPWLPSTSWASSTWPTLVTAGTAPSHLVTGEHPHTAELCWRHGEEHPAPSLKLGCAGERAEPPPACPWTTCPAVVFVFAQGTHGPAESSPHIWDLLISQQHPLCFPGGSGSHPGSCCQCQPGLQAGCENCPQQSFPKCARCHFRALFVPMNSFRRRTHTSMCR